MYCQECQGHWSHSIPVFELLMLHLASSTGWTELSCREAQAFSAGGELGAVGLVLSFLVHSVSEACCWATGAKGPPPWSWGLPQSFLVLSNGCCGPCTSLLISLGEEAFKELGHVSELSDSWELVICLVWTPWMSSSEKRTFFSEPRGDDASAFPWVEVSSLKLEADTEPMDPLTSSDVFKESGLGDNFVFESWSFWSSTSASVRASSSSRNSSNVVSED